MAAKNESQEQTVYNLRLTDVAEEPRQYLLPIEGYEKMPLVTLEEAIQPIADKFPDIGTRVYVAKSNSENPKGGLTVDLSAAIILYTMGKSSDNQAVYYDLNATLRSNKPDRSDQLKPWFLYLKLFITALSYIPSYRGTVYRGVKLDMSEYYKVDKKFVWWGFSSCTKSLAILQSELFLGQEGVGTLFVIDCFSGKEIRHHSYYEKEDEVLLIAARQFVVVGRLNPKPHLWIIQVREIEPPCPFLKIDSSISSKLEMFFCSKQNSDAESNTDDLPCNIKCDKETLMDENLHAKIESELPKLNTNKSVSLGNTNSAETDDQTKNSVCPSLPSTLINSAAAAAAGISDASMADLSSVNNLDAGKSLKDHGPGKMMRYKDQLITEKSAQIIVESIRQNVALEILYLCNNGLKPASVHDFIQVISHRSCLKVFINDNAITDPSVTVIADMLSSAPIAIAQLHLERNCITAVGVKSMVQALITTPTSGLKALSFTGNLLINDACIDDIIHLFQQNHTLKSLYLDRCNLSDEGKQRLRLALIDKKAFSLQL